jgi:hypothetical protein
VAGAELVAAAAKLVAKEQGVLKALYDDLASPGVKQVGKALGTVLETGNIVLLPLRMLNHVVAQHERATFQDIAERFKEIPEERIADVRPEIGVPTLERLSYTQDDALRRMFIELLASAGDTERLGFAHPSFIRVIESLSPDEGKLLESWRGMGLVPSVSIHRKGPGISASTLYDTFYEAPLGEGKAETLSVYAANMEGLGLIRLRPMDSVAQEGAYDVLVEMCEASMPGIQEHGLKFDSGSERKQLKEGDLYYMKGCIEILSYGKMFQDCCLPVKTA